MVKQTKVGMQLLEWKETFLAQWCELFGSQFEALEHYENALALRAKLDPCPNDTQSFLLLGLGRVRRAIGLKDEAISSLSEAFKIAQAASQEATSHKALCLFELSSVLAETGCKLGAMRTLVQAEKIIDVSTGRNSVLHVIILHRLVHLFKDERCAVQSQVEQWSLKAQIINEAVNSHYEWRLGNLGRFA